MRLFGANTWAGWIRPSSSASSSSSPSPSASILFDPWSIKKRNYFSWRVQHSAMDYRSWTVLSSMPGPLSSEFSCEHMVSLTLITLSRTYVACSTHHMCYLCIAQGKLTAVPQHKEYSLVMYEWMETQLLTLHFYHFHFHAGVCHKKSWKKKFC